MSQHVQKLSQKAGLPLRVSAKFAAIVPHVALTPSLLVSGPVSAKVVQAYLNLLKLIIRPLFHGVL